MFQRIEYFYFELDLSGSGQNWYELGHAEYGISNRARIEDCATAAKLHRQH